MSLFSPTPAAHARALHACLSSSAPPAAARPLLAALLAAPLSAAETAAAALSDPTLAPADALRVVGALLAGAHPRDRLEGLRDRVGGSAARSGVCGTVWRKDELAYKCKTCERDPTCAICVSCFRFGDHTGHDYAMIRTAGGCCDCGDVQAWKEAGFCRRHGGASSEAEDPAGGMDRDLRARIVDVAAAVADAVHAACVGLRRGRAAGGAGAAVRPPHRAGSTWGRGGGAGGGGNGEAAHAHGPGAAAAAPGAQGAGNVLWGTATGNVEEAGDAAAEVGAGAGAGAGAGVRGVGPAAGSVAAAAGPGAAPAAAAATSSATPSEAPQGAGPAIRRVRAYLQWLGDLVECGDGVRRVVAVQLAKNARRAGAPWLEHMLGMDGCDQLPPPIHRALHALYYQLITDLVFKRAFLELFAANYANYVNVLVRKKSLPATHPEYSSPDDESSRLPDDADAAGDPEHRSDILDSFSVQLFTVPALIPVMMRDGGVLDVLLRAVLNLFEAASAPVAPYADVAVREDAAPASAPTTPPATAAADSATAMTTTTLVPDLAPAAAEAARDSTGTPDAIAPLIPGRTGDGSAADGGSSSANAMAGSSAASSGRGGADVAKGLLSPMSMLPADVLANPDAFGPFHPINGILFESAFELNGVDEAAAREVRPRGGLRHGDAGAAPGGDDDDDDGDDDNDNDDDDDDDDDDDNDDGGSDDDGDGEVDVDVDGDREDDDGEGGRRRDGGQRGETGDGMSLSGSDLGAGGVPAGFASEAEDGGVGNGDSDDADGEDDTVGEDMDDAVDVHGGGGEMNGGVDDVDVMIENAIEDLDADEGGAAFDRLFVEVEDSDRPDAASLRQDARHRFLAIFDARRLTPAAVSGDGKVLHPLRVDWSRRQPIVESVGWRVIRDLRYVLTHVEVAVHLVHRRPDLLRLFVRFVSMLQGMNPTKRQFGEHVQTDSDAWAKAFTLEIEFFHLIELVVVAFCHDPPAPAAAELSPAQSRMRATSVVRDCLNQWLDREELLERRSVADDAEFTAATAVSIHLPLHRLAAIFGHHMIRLDGVDALAALSGGRRRAGDGDEDGAVQDAVRTLTHPLRIQVFLGQVQAGMWRRNGRAVVGQCMLYRAIICAEWSVDLDLFLMQQCLVVIGAQRFCCAVGSAFDMDEVMRRFQLVNLPTGVAGGSWRESDPDRPASAVAMQLDEYDPTLVESMVTLFVHVTTDRARCGFTDRECLRRKFIHLLCVHDQTHSQLLRACPHWILQSRAPQDNFAPPAAAPGGPPAGAGDDPGASIVEETLADIADFSQPRDMEQGRFRLKASMWEEFDPFLAHLSVRERGAAEQRHGIVRERQRLQPQVIPTRSIASRPLYPQFAAVLTGVSHLVATRDSLIAIMFRRFLQTGGLRALEGVLPPALHIAVTAIEAIPEGDPSAAAWLNSLAPDDAFSGSVLDSAAKMYEASRADSSSLFHECRLAVTRILREAHGRGDAALKSKLHLVAPLLLRSPLLAVTPTAAGSAADKREDSFADNSPSANASRQRMLKKKKEMQTAAMERMWAAQAKFASTMDVGSDSPRAAEGPPAPAAAGATSDGMEEDVAPKVRAEAACEAPASLIKDHVCALCRETDAAPGTMGLVGFAQETQIPFMANQGRASGRGGGGGSAAQESDGDRIETAPGVAGAGTVVVAGGAAEDERRREEAVERMLEARFGVEYRSSGDDHDPAGADSVRAGHAAAAGSALLGGRGGGVPPGVQLDAAGLQWSLLSGGVDSSAGVHVGFCGHAIHIECFQRYYSSLQLSDANSDLYEGHNVLNLTHGEFLCPVCRRMANLVLPMVTLDSQEMMPASNNTQEEKDMATWAHRAFKRHARALVPTSSAGMVPEEGRRAGSEAGADLVAPWATGRSPAADAGADSMPWSHTVMVMTRLGALYEAPSPAGRRAKLSVAFQLPAHHILCCAVGTTIAAAEIAARAGAWDESTARRMVGTLIRQARVRVREVQSKHYGARAVQELWSALMGGSGPPVDSFASVLFLLFRWPARLAEQDVRHLVCAGYVASVDVSRRAKLDPVLGSILYLRRAAVLVGCIYDSDVGLRAYPGDGPALSQADVAAEHLALTSRLGLPRPEEASLAWLVEDLPASPAAAAAAARPASDAAAFVPRRVGLVALPPVFQELLEKLDGRQCDACKRTPRKPALCLVCSRLFCSTSGVSRSAPPGTRACPGWAKRHAQSCGCGIGIFLLLTTTSVHVYRNDRIANWGSPYLDEHGEEDAELRRGKPLRLSRERYSTLERLWLSHGFDHDARVLGHTMLQRGWAADPMFAFVAGNGGNFI